MSKQLRIWFFILLGSLLVSSSLLAGVITMKTSKRAGDRIRLYIEAYGPVSIDGARESYRKYESSHILTSQTITI